MATAQEKLDWELQCYGCSEAVLRKSIESSFEYGMRRVEDLVASMMSDAQQEIEFGMDNRARQTLNRAKFVLFNYMKEAA